MFDILAGFSSLIQYVTIQNNVPDQLRPARCPCCGRANPWLHDRWPRKPDREAPPNESINPIMIQRYYCPGCEKTFSVLPECIPPHRWYLWEVQQVVLLMFSLGQSAYEIAKTSTPSYKTIRRWLVRFQEQFLLHKDTLSTHCDELSRTSGFAWFWQTCLKKMTLGAAMRLCHVAEVIIP
jgi:transposase-like protein